MDGNAVTAIVEGPDGSGKTSTVEMVASQLRANGLRVAVIADPGSTALGRLLRQVLAVDDKQAQEPPNAGAMARMLVYAAARAQTEEEVLLPAMERSDLVLLDRWVPSTLVYQSALAGLPLEVVEQVTTATTKFLTADVAFYMRGEPKLLQSRLKNRGGKVPALGTTQTVVDAYDWIVRHDTGSKAWQGDRWHEIDVTWPQVKIASGMTEILYGLHHSRQEWKRR